MSNPCADLKNQNKDQQMIDFFKGVAAQHGISEQYNAAIENQPWYKKLTQSLHDKYLKTGGIVSQKDLDKAIKRHVTNRDDRTKARLIINLMSLLSNNTLLRDHFWKDLRYEVVERIPIPGMEESMFVVDDKTIIDEDGDEVTIKVPRLSELPTPVLDWMYRYAYSWATAGSEMKLAPGMLGNLQLELFTPRTIERRESTGAIRMAREATEGYADRSAQFHEEFWQDHRSKDRRTVHRGFNSIMNDVQGMSNQVGVDQETMLRIFYGFAKKAGQRRIHIDKETGKVFEYTKWEQTGVGQDGEPIFEWDGAQPMIYGGKQVVLSKIAPPDFRLSPYDEFIDIMKDTQTLFRRIYEATEIRMKRQNHKYNKLQVILGEGRKKHSITGQVYREGEPPIDKKYLDLLTPFFHTLEDGLNVGGFNTITKVITSEDGIHGHMPQMFLSEKLPGLFMKAETEITNKIADLDIEIKAGGLTRTESIAAKTQMAHLKKSLRKITDITSQLGDIQDDPDNETMILSRQQIKNFKSVSNIFHPNDARIDKYIIDDYLDNIGKTLERNDTTIKILEALVRSESKGVSDYVAELYKTTFNHPDVKSTFFGMPTDMITVTKAFKKLGFRVPTRTIMRVMRSIGAYQIYNLLHGGLTGFRNATAVVNKIHDVGVSRVWDALQEYGGANGADWKRRAEKSGVVNFSRYIEGWVNKRLRPDERRAAKEAIRELKIYLKKDNLSKKDYKKYKRYLSSLRLQHHVESKLDTAAQWAVTHNVSDIDLKSKVGLAKSMYQIPLTLYKIIPSIQGTEGFVRTLSYIIGVKSAVKNGFALTYDDPAANEFGIEYTYRSDHGLSQQHLGFAFRGSLGNLNTKLKYWSTQRMGREFRIFTDAVRASGDYSLDDKGKPIGKVGFKNLKNMTKATFGFSRGLREANPYLAAWRSFFLLQGSATYLVDFWLMAPGGAYMGSMARKMFFRNHTIKAGTGLTSDMLSMSFGMINLLWSGLAGLPTPFGEDDEEIKPEEFIMRMARHTHLGVLPMQMLNGLMWMIHHDNKSRSRRAGSWDTNYGTNAVSPMIPLGNTGKGLIEDGFGKSIEELILGG